MNEKFLNEKKKKNYLENFTVVVYNGATNRSSSFGRDEIL